MLGFLYIKYLKLRFGFRQYKEFAAALNRREKNRHDLEDENSVVLRSVSGHVADPAVGRREEEALGFVVVDDRRQRQLKADSVNLFRP
jgi:hypothetical protein